MPTAEITSNGAKIEIETDSILLPTCPEMVELLAAVGRIYDASPTLSEIHITRLGSFLFDYHVVTTGPTRTYNQEWDFSGSIIMVSFVEVTGEWAITELVSNIPFRRFIKEFDQKIGLKELKAIWS